MKWLKTETYLMFAEKEALENAVGLDEEKLTKLIVDKRKENIAKAAVEKSKTLCKEGRCPVCTLPVPCRHFLKKDLIETEENIEVTPKPKCISPLQHLLNYCENPKKEKKRIKLLDDIEKFREKKIHEEIQMIKAEENKKTDELMKSKQKEQKRQKYLEMQKKKIADYKEAQLRSSSDSVMKPIRVRRVQTPIKPSKFHVKFEEIDVILSTQMSLIT